MSEKITRRRLIGGALGMAVGSALASTPLGRTARAEASMPAAPTFVEHLRLAGSDFAAGDGIDVALDPAGRGLTAAYGGGQYTSALLPASAAFTHVGVHWHTSGAPLRLQLRTGEDVHWSAWQDVETDPHQPDGRGGGERFGALIRSGGSGVQLRAWFGGQAVLTSLTATVIEAGGGSSTVVAAAATLPPSAGDVYTRDGWAADESLRFASGVEVWPRMYVPAKAVFVHHTATTNKYRNQAEAAQEVRAIYAYHASTLGWGDIGYNALIDRWGNVYEGRYGRDEAAGRETFSEDVVAGHVSSHNYGSTGVALLGTFTARGEGGKPGDQPTAAMLASLTDYVSWECERHALDPAAASDFLRYDDGWTDALRHVAGHRDANATICPGGNVYAQLPQLRADVALALARPAVSVATTGDVRTVGVSEAGDVTFAWSGPPGAGLERLVEGWHRAAPGSEDLDYLVGFDVAKRPTWLAEGGGGATFGALLAAAGVDIEPGHYAVHVRGTDGATFEGQHTLLVTGDVGNAPPSVNITSPAAGAHFASGATIGFVATATDEDGDLAAGLAWSSDLDGPIGGGASVAAVLSDGTHLVTASVTDSEGALGSDTVTVVVGDPPAGPTLLVGSHKEKGVNFVDLEWSGLGGAAVEVRRDGAALTTTANDGAYSDNVGRGGGSHAYRLCELGGGVCTPEVTVSY